MRPDIKRLHKMSDAINSKKIFNNLNAQINSQELALYTCSAILKLSPIKKYQGALILTTSTLIFYRIINAGYYTHHPVELIKNLSASKKVSGVTLTFEISGNETTYTSLNKKRSSKLLEMISALQSSDPDSLVKQVNHDIAALSSTDNERMTELNEQEAKLVEIKNQISSLDGFEMFLAKKEIQELPRILWENERVEQIVQGRYKDGQGLLLSTNLRLIFIDKSVVLGKLKVEDFQFEKITSVQTSSGVLNGSITIYASGNKAEISAITKNKVQPFADHVRTKINNHSDSAKSNQHIDIEAIERLAVLFEKGLLTESEFATQKQQIFNKN